MTDTAFLGMIRNAALLLAVAFIYDVTTSRFRVRPRLPILAAIGVLLGIFGCILILSPWTFVPGIVFDTRSVLLAVSGLFFGLVPTAVAMAMTAAFRLHLGGAAAWTGVAVILATGSLGIAWRHHRRQALTELSWHELYLFGFLVHLVMLALMFTLPWETALKVLSQISLPVLGIYPVVTTLLGLFMVNRLRQESNAALLQASEERMRLFFERQIVGMAITSPQKGWLQVNDELCRMLGYPREELTRMTWPELTHPDDLRPDLDQFELLLTGTIDEYSIEKRFIRKDGAIVWTELSVGCVRRADKTMGYILALLVDITDRKRAEETLRLFKILVENSTDAIGMSNPAGKHFYQNEAFTDLFGTIGEDPPASVYVDQAVGREVFQTVMTGGRWDGEVKMFAKDGRIVDVSLRAYATKDDNGRVIGLVGIHTDITEAITAKNALRESEERYRTLVNNLPGLAYRCLNDAYWTMVFFSEGAKRMTGYPAADFIDNAVRSYASIIHPEDRTPVERAVQEGVGAHRPYEMEYRLIRADGNIIWVYEKGQGIFDASGNLLWLDGVIVDITQHLKAEEEKERLQDQLTQAQKMESIGRLAGGVAHDFNNMLQTILGHSDLLLIQSAPQSPAYEGLLEIRKAAERSADLTRQLLAFARKQAVTPRVLDLNDTVSGMLKMLQRLIGEDIDLTWMPGHNLWPVRIDPSQVDQILANLAVNARDAIAGVGTLTIETADAAIDEAYCENHEQMTPGDYVMLAVSDNGCGIAPEALPYIFEPFFTTKEQGKGTGLGLATIYGIVMQNNGCIHIDSKPGQGSTISIYLPRFAASDKEALSKNKADKPVGGTETILIVEDEDAILRLGITILERLGYTVLSALSPKEAIRLAGEYPDDIHLLLTDVVMPEMNGRELVQHLTAIRPSLKYLYMSGYTSDIIARQGILDNGVRFVQKPFSFGDLARKIREALEHQEERA